VRDTFLLLGLTAGLAFGYWYLHHDSSTTPGQSKVTSSSPSWSSTFWSSIQKYIKGENDSETINSGKNGKARAWGKNQRASGKKGAFEGSTDSASESAERSEAIPSLYSRQGRRVKNKSKVIHGVPVEAWAEAQAHALGAFTVTPDSESSLRVFVNCMEMRKGKLDPIAERECHSLAGVNDNSRRNKVLGIY
jgi:hypothetical protein